MNDLESRLQRAFKHAKLIYGGDGALVAGWRGVKKPLFPVRNYGLCEKHAKFYEDFANGNGGDVRQFLFSPIEFKPYSMEYSKTALSEVTVMNDDVTSCLRYNIYLNGKLVSSNVISSGMVFATVLGSTGYFKSVARTIFRDGIGLAHVDPTYSIPNMVFKKTDLARIEFVRDARVRLAFDKDRATIDVKAGDVYEVSSSGENVSIFGYDHFMCEECRRGRNSTIVNDSYNII